LSLTHQTEDPIQPSTGEKPQVGCIYRDRHGASLRVVALVYDAAVNRQISSVVVEFADGTARRIDLGEWRTFNAELQPSPDRHPD
jgi:hypothetical protein